MTLLQSLADWIERRRDEFPELDSLSIVKMGDDGDLSPPFLGMVESGSAIYEQGDVTLYGVSTYEITCELHTVPADEDNDGTPADTERTIRQNLYDILGNRDAIEWINGRNQWTVFDIRAAGPTTEAQDGRRVTRWTLSIVAAPL